MTAGLSLTSSPSWADWFVLSGLAVPADIDAPVPAPELADAQLRAVNHRFLHEGMDARGHLLDSLTDDDLLVTSADGQWSSREGFLARVRAQQPHPESRIEDQCLRLFGPVAVVHGVISAPLPGGRKELRRYTDVHLWRGGMWRLVSSQDTPLDETVAMSITTGATPLHAPWQGEDPVGNDEYVLRQLNDDYVRAFREADVAWYAAHLATDYLVVQGDGRLMDRSAALARFARPVFAETMKSFPVAEVSVRCFGDVALIHAENAFEMKNGRRGRSRYTDIWHRRCGRWVCVAAHITAYRTPSI